jgi:hypothetical protein
MPDKPPSTLESRVVVRVVLKPLRVVIERPRVLLGEVSIVLELPRGSKVVQLISLEVEIIWKCGCKIALHME